MGSEGDAAESSPGVDEGRGMSAGLGTGSITVGAGATVGSGAAGSATEFSGVSKEIRGGGEDSREGTAETLGDSGSGTSAGATSGTSGEERGFDGAL